jgi:DNA-binding response OmpR family regulator
MKKRILYIEDHEDTAETVKTILSKAGFDVNISLRAKEGIKKAEQHFDLIILDIMLPDMSGWDIFQTLQKKLRGVRYMFLSALPVTEERREELRRAGISDYITKPFTKDDLVNRVRKVLA